MFTNSAGSCGVVGLEEKRSKVLIKGTKEGLLFFLADDGDFGEILEELEFKLQEAHDHFFDGPVTDVTIQAGNRILTEDQETALRAVFDGHKNLVVRRILSDDLTFPLRRQQPPIRVVSGTVRSGQVLTFDEDVLLLGDVNPGGVLQSAGDVLILGALRGIAHAGCRGARDRIIAASLFVPTQLRIADQLSRPPEGWSRADWVMQFAYLEGERIFIDQIHQLSRIRPEVGLYFQKEGERANG